MSRVAKQKQTTFALPVELLEATQELSRRTRIPQAAFIREGIALVVRKYAAMLGDKLPASVESYVEPAHLNAHNALAWKEPWRMPGTVEGEEP